MDLLLKDLDWMNKNPFRQTNSIFSPSGQNDMTDIELVTEDRFPWRFFGGVDNSGIRQSGRTRYFAGFNWGNVFNLDHILSFQFTSGSKTSNYWSTSLHYTAPLPWRHTFITYGGYSHIKADLEAPGMKTKGYSAQASFRYEIPLHPLLNFLEDFLLGFDWKRTNTSIDQEGDLFFDQSVNLTQLTLGYNGGYESSWYKISATLEVYGSPGRWLPDQSRKCYQELREGANNRYVYARLAVAPILEMGYGFTLHARVRGQLSSTNLLASEQFGLGGWDTVRGYQVREVNADNVFIVLSARQLNPKLRIISRAFNKKSEAKLYRAGADYVVLPERVGGFYMATMVQKPDVIEFMSLVSKMGSGQVMFEEFETSQLKEEYQGKTIREMGIRGETGSNIIALHSREGNYIINPGPDTFVRNDMRLVVLGNRFQMKKFRKVMLKKGDF